MPINCVCDDTTGHRTLLQLRTALIERLGFADPLTAATRTLVQVRESMLYLLGYGTIVANPSPGIAGTLDQFINEAQQSLFRRLELDEGDTVAPARMSADSDPTTLDYQPIQTLALAMACAHYGKPEAKAYFEQHEKYVSDVASRRPPGLVAQLNQFLAEAQLTIIRRYPELRTERWFTWNLTANERFYDLPDNAEQTEPTPCDKLLDPSRITWVGIQRDTFRVSLREGIHPGVIGFDTASWPTHYEIRQCIELWPAPAATEGTLLIKGHFQPAPFAADADVTTIDDHAVYLLALANAKAHYRQPDAPSYISQFEVHLMTLVAGTHGTHRYIPGQRPQSVYVEPVWTDTWPPA